MSYFVSKIGHLDPRFYSLIYCAIPGVQMSGVQMSDFISKIGYLDPRFYSLIYCDTGGPDVGGPDVGGPDVGGSDVGGPDVGGPNGVTKAIIPPKKNKIAQIPVRNLKKLSSLKSLRLLIFSIFSHEIFRILI